MRNKIAFTALVLSLSACSSTTSTHSEKHLGLIKGKSHYYVEVPTLKLTLGHGAIPGDSTFLGEEALQQEFYQALKDQFAAHNILAVDAASADASVQLVLDYERRFNWGGKALNKPEFGYNATVKRGDAVLASYSVKGATTSYGVLKDTAVNLQISTFKWGVDDEPKDINLIAETIAKEIANINSK